MDKEILNKIKDWIQDNFWYDDNARSLAVNPNDLEDYLVELVKNQSTNN